MAVAVLVAVGVLLGVGVIVGVAVGAAATENELLSTLSELSTWPLGVYFAPSAYPLPALSIVMLEKVATPLTLFTVVVPPSVAPVGLVPRLSVIDPSINAVSSPRMLALTLN